MVQSRKEGRDFYSEQSVVHQVQPRGLQVQAAFLLELWRKARQRSTALHRVIVLQDAVSAQGRTLPHEANKKEKVCLLGCSAGVALVDLYSEAARIDIPLYW